MQRIISCIALLAAIAYIVRRVGSFWRRPSVESQGGCGGGCGCTAINRKTERSVPPST
jgi:hypothetical protein